MNRIFGDYVYSDAPRAECFWDTLLTCKDVPELSESQTADVAIIGAGVTGLNAALHLAKGGANVVVLDTNFPGWGASARNGGFCCLGGARLEDAKFDKLYGKSARLEWRRFEVLAVEHVAGFLEETQTDVDRHSVGETLLLHRARDAAKLDDYARSVKENYGTLPEVLSKADLEKSGMSAGFHGGLTIPIGFALNPAKYTNALVNAAVSAGVRIFQNATVSKLQRSEGEWILVAGRCSVKAQDVVVATNGYSSENVPDWLQGRYMPAQSSIGVTRVLTKVELEAQNWIQHQMCYDSRNMLHYFRLMPDKRMLFGLRGGLQGNASGDTTAAQRLSKHFARMFPAWRNVPFENVWSGMVCLTRKGFPIVGPVTGQHGLWCAIGFHGNGVAMGSFLGATIASSILNDGRIKAPEFLDAAAKKFPLGRFRRAIMPPAYVALTLADL